MTILSTTAEATTVTASEVTTTAHTTATTAVASTASEVEVVRIVSTVLKEWTVDKDKYPISGLIELTLGTQGSVQGTPKRAAVAGKGEVWARVRRGRQLLPASRHADAVYSMVIVSERPLLSSNFDLFPNSQGMSLPVKARRDDINADGAFNAQMELFYCLICCFDCGCVVL